MNRTLLLGLIFVLTQFQLVLCQDASVEDEMYLERKTLVDSLFTENADDNKELIEAFMEVRRDWYIDNNYLSIAYRNMPIPSKGGLIHPSPEMIADILKSASIDTFDKVLVIGRNSMYINQLISRLSDNLFVIDPTILMTGEYGFQLKNDMSYYGWLEEGPFNVIIFFGSVEEIPQSLFSQLSINGQMIFPLSYETGNQILTSIKKYGNSFTLKSIGDSYIHKLR